jgi:16S rRNA C1402 (ribose-2'-O) methylase RsmI
VHEPLLAVVERLAAILQVSVAYLYCEDEDIARLLLALYGIPAKQRKEKVLTFLSLLSSDLPQ